MRGWRSQPVVIRGVTYPSAAAAAKDLGVTATAISFAKSRGRLDHVGQRKRVLTSRADEDRPSYGDVDVQSCRRLWVHVLYDQVQLALGEPRRATCSMDINDQEHAIDWFFRPDAALVAQFAGVDFDMLRDWARGVRAAVSAARAARPHHDRRRISLEVAF